MADAVLDSSAILTMLWSDTGYRDIERVIGRALVSVVNEAEVISVLIQRGETPARAIEFVRVLPYELIDLDRNLARRAGALWREFKPRGLSLGDRCCLALAEREKLPAWTSDQRWADLNFQIPIHLIR